jgi:ATP-dependent DNA ligase
MAVKKKLAARIAFVESMECLPVATLPEGREWSYEIKLDGFRLEAVKKNGKTSLYSRRGNLLNRKFPYVAEALGPLPDFTILDGEVVALDSQGRSDFGLLQNFRSAESKIHYYVFDILALKGRDVSVLPLGSDAGFSIKCSRVTITSVPRRRSWVPRRGFSPS